MRRESGQASRARAQVSQSTSHGGPVRRVQVKRAAPRLAIDHAISRPHERRPPNGQIPRRPNAISMGKWHFSVANPIFAQCVAPFFRSSTCTGHIPPVLYCAYAGRVTGARDTCSTRKTEKCLEFQALEAKRGAHRQQRHLPSLLLGLEC